MADVKVKVLEDFGREAELRKKWVRMWEKLGERILKLPKWMQTIILEDVNTPFRGKWSAATSSRFRLKPYGQRLKSSHPPRL
jgi:hypothetical protein